MPEPETGRKRYLRFPTKRRTIPIETVANAAMTRRRSVIWIFRKLSTAMVFALGCVPGIKRSNFGWLILSTSAQISCTGLSLFYAFGFLKGNMEEHQTLKEIYFFPSFYFLDKFRYLLVWKSYRFYFVQVHITRWCWIKNSECSTRCWWARFGTVFIPATSSPFSPFLSAPPPRIWCSRCFRSGRFGLAFGRSGFTNNYLQLDHGLAIFVKTFFDNCWIQEFDSRN